MPVPLRAALAACGGISDLTLNAARRSPDFHVTAIQDVDPEALQQVGVRHGITRRHTTFEALLTDDIDFVIINSPNHVHREQLEAAAAAGKPCLVQKPMARSLAEAETMVKTADTHGILLGVTMFELSRPVNHQLRAMVEQGWLGEPVLVDACGAHTIYMDDPPPAENWRRDPARVGGGAFLQLGVHHLNLANWVLGRRALSVLALGTRSHTVFEDETTLATVTYEGGVLGRFTASYSTDAYWFAVLGTRGWVHVFSDHVVVKGKARFAGDLFTYDTPGQERVFTEAELAPGVARLADTFEVHGWFARWIRDDEPYPCPGESAIQDMKILEAVHHARRTGQLTNIA
jgi:predicted dehydrogenase